MSDEEKVPELTTIRAARLEVNDVRAAIAKKFSGKANVQGLPSFLTMLPDGGEEWFASMHFFEVGVVARVTVKVDVEVHRAQWKTGNAPQLWWCIDLDRDKIVAKVDAVGCKEGGFRWEIGRSPIGNDKVEEGFCDGNAPSDRQARREASAVLRARGFAVSSLLKGDML